MSSYVVLARKWRPAQFADIVGQNHIVRTLLNAIKAQRIHQAYLFTGSRGIGKTSIARIFAKALRCENTKWIKLDESKDEADWLTSCDECSSCKEITGSTSVDVIEIDGASNNGVEAVREIRENAKFLPSVGSRKLYIIDEVHMLSTAAFNALLKTLEEPPPHVVFIFATTEPHKIPATILSRCQRFDYRRVTLAQIQQRLLQVTAAEGLQAEPGALALIGRAAEGSMRDALSLLDQVIAFSGNRITVQSTRESVGLIEGQLLLGLIKAVFERKPLDATQFVEQVFQRGHDLRVLTRSLIEFLHGAILAKVGATASTSLELNEEEWNELKKITELRPLEEIEMIFQVLHNGLDWIAHSPQPKIILDILLIKCATAESLDFVSTGASGTGTSAGTHSPHATPQATASTVAPAATPTPAPIKLASPIATPPSAPTPAIAVPPAPVAAPVAAMTPKVDLNWDGFVTVIRKTRPLLASILDHATSTITSDSLVIFFNSKNEHYRDQLQSRIYHDQLLQFVRGYFSKSLRIQVEIRDSADKGNESVAEKRERTLEEKRSLAREAVHNHPVIREAKALFGGELGAIDLLDDEVSETGGAK